MSSKQTSSLNVKLISIIVLLSLFLTAKPNMEKVSQFIIELIEKYDDTGKGVIPSKKYPNFLQELFIKGYQQAYEQQQENRKILKQQLKQLLLQATSKFGAKYDKKEYVQLQQFYMDLIKDFTYFLQAHRDQYQIITQTFFGDSNISSQQQQEEKIDRNNEEDQQKQNIQL